MNSKSIKQLTISGAMIALTVILSFPALKIPGTTIGVDSLPAFLTAIVLGPVAGGLVGFIGHMLSAAFMNFPYSLPLHLIVGGMMFVTCFVYGNLHKSLSEKINATVGRIVAVVVGVILNGPISLALASYVAVLLGAPVAGMVMFVALIGGLTVATAINIILAEVIYLAAGKEIKQYI